eukprot:GCRY01001053.1.p1 GENE.GCRY01001053.1~~GCRY01001053.1.p1  ORF type:complete len:662 (-),score=140.92 GCRY01001053.1:174-2159(-)
MFLRAARQTATKSCLSPLSRFSKQFFMKGQHLNYLRCSTLPVTRQFSFLTTLRDKLFQDSKTINETGGMFCWQCEQTMDAAGCTKLGICGKTPEVAALQDLLIQICKGCALIAEECTQMGIPVEEANDFIIDALFATITNVNFDPSKLKKYLDDGVKMRCHLEKEYLECCSHRNITPVSFQGCDGAVEPSCPASTAPSDGTAPASCKEAEPLSLEEYIQLGKNSNFANRFDEDGKTVVGLQETILYGLKGMAAYYHHARVLGARSEEVEAFIRHSLAFMSGPDAARLPDLLHMALETGRHNLKTMELLDGAHTRTFGNPVPTPVLTTPHPGPAILVSGHDLQDLQDILYQTKDLGVNVYTHGEMLPAHGYPGLKDEYPHLIGHYGTAWQNQRKEFAAFPGPIVMTTNCIMPPRKKDTYSSRLYTKHVVGAPHCPHLDSNSYGDVIRTAIEIGGFKPEECPESEEHKYTVGFGHHAVLSLADTILSSISSGDISRFFVIGGCDGSEKERNTFTQLAENLPQSAVVLTAGCGKYRINHLNMGKTEKGIPRLLDCGQCNDSFSAALIAIKLAEALNCSLQDLPLDFAISWFEQKAVAVLLTLLHLGVRDIKLGPELPAFLTDEALGVLHEKFGLSKISEDVCQVFNLDPKQAYLSKEKVSVVTS